LSYNNLLTGLKVFRFELKLEALTEISFPNFPGIALRGGFGHALRRIVCAVRAENIACRDCSLAGACPYSVMFESPNVNPAPRMRGATVRPHPFAIIPGLSGPAVLTAGSIFSVYVTLFEQGIKFLPYVIHGFRNLGNSGLGRSRGKFRILEILCVDSEKEVMNAESKVDMDAVVPYHPETDRIVSRLMLEFLTPCRIQYHRKPLRKPHFQAIIRNIVRKLENISYFYGPAPVQYSDTINYDGLELITMDDVSVIWESTSRYSRRQDMVMPMEGFTGYAMYEGPLSQYYPYLKYAEATGLGKNTSFGFGAVMVKVIE